MIEFDNKIYEGSDGRKSLFDCRLKKDNSAVVIFVHGYKGYKDWGAWGLMQLEFVKQGFGFVKFNFSHNGGTIDDPIDFPDLDAFGKNRFSYELFDLDQVVTETKRLLNQELEIDIPIYLIGHSRGGGVAILHSSRDERILKTVSLAGISNIDRRFPKNEDLEEWKREGVRYVENSRTKQAMPHYFSFYDDFIAHSELLNIESAVTNLKNTFLQIHGDMDESISISEGLSLAKWSETEIKVIKGAEHTFGTKQPWESKEMPDELQEAIEASVEFFKTPTS